MNGLEWFFIAGTALVGLATLLPLSRQVHWTIRVWDFPRVQLAVAAAALLALAAGFIDIERPVVLACVIVLALSLGWHLWWILPYTRVHRPEVRQLARAAAPGKTTLTLMTANVLMPAAN